MKKTVDIINAIFFHIHLAYLIIMLLISLNLYLLPKNIFQSLTIWIELLFETLLQLLLNAVLFAVSSGFSEEVNFKKHSFAAISLFAISSLFLFF